MVIDVELRSLEICKKDSSNHDDQDNNFKATVNYNSSIDVIPKRSKVTKFDFSELILNFSHLRFMYGNVK